MYITYIVHTIEMSHASNPKTYRKLMMGADNSPLPNRIRAAEGGGRL